MRFMLIRHGQTEWNLSGRLQGSSDIRLNDQGRAEAARTAASLTTGDWGVVVSSPLLRAQETADIIAANMGIRRGGNYPLLRERSFGAAEGLTPSAAALRWPAAGIRDAMADGLGMKFPTLGVPEVEPIDEVRARGFTALEALAADLAPTSVVVVCHGTLIRCILSQVAGHEVPRIRNGEARELELADGAWWIVQE